MPASHTDRRANGPITVAALGYPDVQGIDLVGPLEAFAMANDLATDAGGPAPYNTLVLGLSAAPFRAETGVRLVPDCAYDDVPVAIDTLLVPGGRGARLGAFPDDLFAWLRTCAGQARRIASVCTGAYILARAGLLDGRRATTHWRFCGDFAGRFPAVVTEPDPLFVRDGGVFTSAGATAGIDLALALIEDDLGHAAALKVARELVVYLKRSGGQSQYSAHLTMQVGDTGRLKGLEAWIADNLAGDLSVGALASRVAMSPRHFARVFARQTGRSPGRHVELVRLDAARRRLEECADTLDRVALACGFGTGDTMRRVFVRHLGVTPSDYRARFRKVMDDDRTKSAA